VQTANVLCGNVNTPISSGGLALLAKHFASINYVTVLRVLNLILIAEQTVTYRDKLFPLHNK